MSELNTHDNRATIHWKLLTGVSALALTAYVSSVGVARAEDADHPQLWIELGGQLEDMSGAAQPFKPPFFSSATPAVLAPMINAQRPTQYSLGENAEISFSPDQSDWVFSAALRYGRSGAVKHRHYQSHHLMVPFTNNGYTEHFTATREEFGDGQNTSSESHLIADFAAGKDVGLGLFGQRGSSVLSAGVRFAQFASKSDITLHARPTYVSGPFYTYTSPRRYKGHYAHYRRATAFLQAKRSVHAVGPSLSWDASAPVVGEKEGMEVTLDWGADAAVLFGRQHSRTQHQTSGAFHSGLVSLLIVSTYKHGPYDHDRARTITIPNVGGFAGMSLKFPNAKISIGYQADLFFNAMDVGIDARKSATLGFYGPFASVSVGIGG